MEKQAALDLLEFIHESPTNFHAVLSIKQRLQAHGFKQLFSGEAWHIEHGGKYFVTKNHSSLYAFIPGNGNLAEEGFKLICAHSDSPTFRIKPHAEMPVEGKYLKLNTEVYGGPIMYTWFDRPLSMAGRVMVKSDKPLKPATQFINFDRPLLEIPHIAIHFNRAVNDQGNPLSKQRDMLPVIAMINETFEKDNFLLKLIAQEMNIPAEDILDFDLTLYEYGKDIIYNTEKMSLNRNILNKKYYMVIPYYSEELGQNDFDKDEVREMAFSELYTRAQAIIRTLSVSGVMGRVLSSTELADLLYFAYNREDAEVFGVDKAIKAGYNELYSTAPDYMDKKMEMLDKQIEDAAVNLASDKIAQVQTEKEKEYQRKVETEDDIINNLAQLIIQENEAMLGKDVAEKAKEKVRKEKKANVQ